MQSILLGPLFLILACPDPTAPPSMGEGGGPSCDTDPPSATDGGDYGPGWLQEQADEESGVEPPRLDVGVLGDEDPVSWEHHTSTGVYYRSPTDTEMASYGWTSDALLVIPQQAFVDDVVDSEATTSIRIPIHDFAQSRPQQGLTITNIALTKQWDTFSVPYRLIVQPRNVSATRTTLYPKISYYLPTAIAIDAIPERVLAVVSSSRGGLTVFGGAPYEEVHMRGPYTDGAWFDLEIPPLVGATFFVLTTVHSDESSALQLGPPGGVTHFVARQAVTARGATGLTARPISTTSLIRAGQCDDDLDNDPDCAADEDDYNCTEHTDYGGHIYPSTAEWEQSKDFALFGDLSFCSSCEGVDDDCSPETELTEYAIIATSILNSVEPIPAYTPDIRMPPFRMTMYGCLAIYSEHEQQNCDTSTSCDLAGYPLLNTDDDYSQKLAKVWNFVDWAVGGMAAADRRPVHIAGILTDIFDSTNAEPGLAFAWDPEEPDKNGALIVRRNNSGAPAGAGRSLAHEIGHTLGLDDDDPSPEALSCKGEGMGATNMYPCSMVWPSDGNYYLGFMRQGNGFAPILDWDDDSAVPTRTQGDVWKDLAPSKFVPRASGFGWTDCNAMGHPGCSSGLQCNIQGVCDYD